MIRIGCGEGLNCVFKAIRRENAGNNLFGLEFRVSDFELRITATDKILERPFCLGKHIKNEIGPDGLLAGVSAGRGGGSIGFYCNITGRFIGITLRYSPLGDN